ncbi:MAG: hypothetical protein CM15mP68_1500 [Pseudomonadota bacterium]|nr:MAG: hypothetical protein CM15mP68_1500 [Pseudomonadota bacterium]
MGHSLGNLSSETKARDDFFIGNMVPTCISDDKAAAAAVNRKTLDQLRLLYRTTVTTGKKAGYEEEMNGVEAAIADKDFDRDQNAFRPLVGRHHFVWQRQRNPRGHRSLVRRGHKDPHHRAVVSLGRTDPSPRGILCPLGLMTKGPSACYATATPYRPSRAPRIFNDN